MEKDTTTLKKKDDLIRRLKELDSLLVAFSGGVDSTFLLALAHQVLGDRVVAATASSITYPSREREEAVKFTSERRIQHIVFRSDEDSLPEFISNGPDRCYHCKKFLCQSLIKIADEKGLKYVAHAANLDDLKDYRPGLKAAEEMGIISPLVDAQLSKGEIRLLSKEMGLATWDKPAMACLASRIPYGSPITPEKLKMVNEAEEFLSRNGFKQFRVRHHGPVARIEVESTDIAKITESEFRKRLVAELRQIGFLHIAVDLEGYVSGSLNRAVGKTSDRITPQKPVGSSTG
ncbi:MAG: ATP-dependent sacrificial sulfur transferase LarE [Desulfobacteraceae bacterium]|nr:ATP-dependent sacrificial sulfur transferase LarE [Desulfobacteraceae bacterium]